MNDKEIPLFNKDRDRFYKRMSNEQHMMFDSILEVVSRFFRKFISSASKYRHQMYGFSSSAGCSISILNRCSMSI